MWQPTQSVDAVPLCSGRGEAGRQVAARADAVLIRRGDQFRRVRIVTVRAGDAPGVHPALQERPVDVDLVLHAPVREVQVLLEQRGQVSIGERSSVGVVQGEHAAPRVAAAAGLRLLLFRRGRAASGDTGCRVHAPLGAVLVVEVDGQAVVRRECAGPGLRKVLRTRAVTGLAADRDLGVRRGERVRVHRVVRPQVGRVAFGTGVVPVQVDLAPVERIVRADVLVGVEVEPALSALCLGPRVPGDGEGLLAAVREVDEVLLQGPHAERVRHLPGPGRAVGGLRADHEVAVLTVEAGGLAVVGEFGAVEVAEHGIVAGDLHRLLVVRTDPVGIFGAVAVPARAAADEFGDGRRCRRLGIGRGSVVSAAGEQGGTCRGHGQYWRVRIHTRGTEYGKQADGLHRHIVIETRTKRVRNPRLCRCSLDPIRPRYPRRPARRGCVGGGAN